MNEFDLINSPLSGVNLIEASAGTGKTHTISFLLLRLILEKRLTIDRILVVTFTQAATQELKERVFSLLLMTRDALVSGKSNEPLIQSLIKQREKKHQDLETVQNAIIDFDKASIFTIHGFCSRILHDNAFETANRFDEDLIQDPFHYLQEVTDDFWRKNIYSSPTEFVSYLYPKVKDPEYFLNLVNKVNALEIDVIPSISLPKIESLTPFRETLKAIKKTWNSSKDDILASMMNESLKGNIYGTLQSDANKPSKRHMKITSLANDMDIFLGKRSTGFPLFKKFELFTASKINNSAKKHATPPEHTFFDMCNKLDEIAVSLEKEFESLLLHLKGCLFTFADSELDKIKYVKNIRFFNDLILKVRSGIRNSADSDRSFINEIRNKYKAALVDEFQDTDSVQYEIFSTLFSSKESLLFMIGDPKQAIYGFRGADVFSYLQAARQTESAYTLTENWRSSGNLITAINTFFSNIKNPFIFKDISFDHGRPATDEKHDHPLETAPVKIWFVRTDSGKPLNKSDAEKLAAKAIAGEITALISSKKNQCNEQFREGDIAVLVRTNRQALIMKQYLSQMNINSILFNIGDLFLSHEAEEMERVLAAISNPGNERKMKSAFCTDMMGLTAGMFVPELKESQFIQDIYKRFKHYKRLWDDIGFTHMFNLFLIEEAVKQRLLTYPDGERRVTNILHLGEILQDETITNKRQMTGLIKWLSEQRDPDVPRREEHQLHLESDRRAVNIVTMHKSKGLEYPVVFCPFSWMGMGEQENDIWFHNDDAQKKLTFDLRGKDAGSHLTLAQKEQLAENMRLFYVAVTRAKKVCYLTWGNIRSANTSAISYLLYGDEIDDNADIVNALNNHVSFKSSDDLLSDLKRFSSRSEGTIDVLPLEKTKDALNISSEDRIEKDLFSRKFQGNIDTSWKVLSYSSLVSAREKESDIPDHDGFMQPHTDVNLIPHDEVQANNDTIFSFPKGVKAGIFFHDLLEHLDFTSNASKTAETVVLEKLQLYGFDLKWKNTVSDIIDNILTIPFVNDNSSLTLSKIGNNDRINEMEFYYPINTITPENMVNLFSGYQRPDVISQFSSQLEKLTFSPSQGFMKGYIDLIFLTENQFYLIDWKSNFLGSDIEDYNSDRLDNVMNHSFYTLQYHIYTLALHQYLTNRFAEYTYKNNFGGIFYIFIRGVDKNQGPSYGIFKDRPNPDLINNMGNLLIPGFKMA